MILKTRAVLLAQEKKTSAKGNEYSVVLIQQGTDTLKMMCKNKDLPVFEVYKEYDITCNYNVSFKELQLLDIKKV